MTSTQCSVLCFSDVVMCMCLRLQACSLEQPRGSGPCFQHWAYLIVVPNDWPFCPIIVPAAGPDSRALATTPMAVLIKALSGEITFPQATQGAPAGCVPAACQATGVTVPHLAHAQCFPGISPCGTVSLAALGPGRLGIFGLHVHLLQSIPALQLALTLALSFGISPLIQPVQGRGDVTSFSASCITWGCQGWCHIQSY